MQEFVGALIKSINVAQLYHWSTESYARHEALGAFYSALPDMLDELVESYQGEYGIVADINVPATRIPPHEEQLVTYFENMLKYVRIYRKKLPQDDFLAHQYDDIEKTFTELLYKLKNLR